MTGGPLPGPPPCPPPCPPPRPLRARLRQVVINAVLCYWGCGVVFAFLVLPRHHGGRTLLHVPGWFAWQVVLCVSTILAFGVGLGFCLVWRDPRTWWPLGVLLAGGLVLIGGAFTWAALR